ncbi:MAG: type II secretion system F family protein [Actinomycetota bacterium]
MAEYSYRALDERGQARTGVLEADTEVVAVSRLREQGWTPLKVEAPGPGMKFKADIRIPGLSDRISLKDVAVSSRQLATMIDAGLPLMRAISVLAEQTENKALSQTWESVRGDVQAGMSFSGALAKHPKAFNTLYVAVIRAGETGGALDQVLLRLADTLEKQVNLRNKIRSAMTYPIMVAILVVVILSAILLFIIPTFKQLYNDLGGTLPVPTRFLLACSDIFRRFILFIIPAMGVGLYLLKKYVNTDKGRHQFDAFKLKIPIFGELFRKVAMSRMSRTLGTLMRSGVPVLQSLQITKETTGNRIVSDAVEDVENSVRQGESLAKPLGRHKVIPPMVTQMLAVGEETGAVDTMLEKVADFYDSEVDATVDALTSLIEPLLIVFLGAVVGGILISLYLPMFKIVDLIQ